MESPAQEPSVTGCDLRLTTLGKALVARPTADIDLSNAERLGDHIAEAIPAGALGLILDLTDVGYLDSVGIYVIIGLSKRLAQRGQSLVLVVPNGSLLKHSFSIGNIGNLLQIVGGTDEALSALAADGSTA